MKRIIACASLFLLPVMGHSKTTYDWKLGVYIAPQQFSFKQKDDALGVAKGSAFILQNLQLTAQKKLNDWVLTSSINHSSLKINSTDKDQNVDLLLVTVGAIYLQQWKANIEYEQVPIINSKGTTKSFDSLNTTWLTFGHQRKIFHPRFQVFGLLSYPLLMNSSIGPIQQNSGYKINLGTDYRIRLKKSWDFYLRPFFEYKHWQMEFAEPQDKTNLTIIQYGLRFGLNKFF